MSAPIPAHDDKTSAVALYSETTLSVKPNGAVKRLERRAYRILRPDGEAYGTVRVDYDSQSRITGLRAWCIPVSGKDYEVKAKDAVESALPGVEGGELVSDLRTLLLRIPAATPGNTVGYEVEKEQRPYVLADEWDLQDTLPLREAHYTLQLPPGWGYKATWLNHAEVTPAATGASEWQWTVNDVPPVKLERDMPPWRGIAARMFVSLEPNNGMSRGFQTWQEMGTWIVGLTQDRRIASPAIKQKVAELTAGVPTMLGKMQALATFVQRDIRYVAIELGIGGMQPHPASDVFANRFGDCKDKVTLLSTMLREIGVESYYVVINTRRGSITSATPPTLGFNHVIVAIRLPDGGDSQTPAPHLTHAKLGRILYFDPTDPLTPLGRLAGPLQANFGLLVTPDGGELVRLPVLPTNSNGIERTAKLSLDETGVLRGDVREVWLGDMAADQRIALRSVVQDTDKIRPVESVLAHSLTKFQLLNATVRNAPAIQMPLEWNYSLEADEYAKASGPLLLVRPRVLGSKTSAILEGKEPRQHPIEFEGPERDTDVFEITLPAGYDVEELPPPVDVDYGFASYRSATTVVGHALHYTRTFEIKELSVPPGRANELRDLYRIIDDDERRSAILTRKP